MTEIRTRFAPSPTGFLHVGGLRTALYNYLFAKKNKGVFILRIEDTDRERYVKGSEKQIIESLTWAGIKFDEGPILDEEGKIEKSVGKYGPYIQSKRLDLYKNYALQLQGEGKAYQCFCSKERLEELRQEQVAAKQAPKYDEHCRNLTPNECKKLAMTNRFVIRFKIPKKGTTSWEDLIHGQIAIENEVLDDFVMIKEDGFPTYNFANVIDDHLMKISQVIRGEEFLSSTPKHILLYQAFDWTVPQFAHLPLLLSKERTKLSKRQGDVAVSDYIKKGYLAEALVNFVALLGWNPGKDIEILDRKSLISKFSLKDIHKSGAVFDLDKLNWMNGLYIRQCDLETLAKECIPFLVEAKLIEVKNKEFIIIETGEKIDINYLKKVVKLEQERIKILSELPVLTRFFFVKLPKYDPKLVFWKKMDKKSMNEHLEKLIAELKTYAEKEFVKEKLETKLMNFIKKENLGVGETLWPMRVALSGEKASPGPFEIAEVLGKEKVIFRLKSAQNTAKKI